MFGALRGAITNDQLDSIANITTPLLTTHRNDIALDEQLFLRVKAVYDMRAELKLDSCPVHVAGQHVQGLRAQRREPHAGSQDDASARLNDELSMLSLKFNQNLLKETNGYRMVVDKKEDLDGLPAGGCSAAAAAAAEKAGQPGKWVFTLQKPSWIPFLQYATNRALREKLYRAYCNRGDNGNASDNKLILARIAALRAARAQVLGYKTHADYVLEENMAKTPATVY